MRSACLLVSSDGLPSKIAMFVSSIDMYEMVRPKFISKSSAPAKSPDRQISIMSPSADNSAIRASICRSLAESKLQAGLYSNASLNFKNNAQANAQDAILSKLSLLCKNTRVD